MMAKASSNRSTRRSKGKPNARYSTSFHPAPNPRINLPPLISSMAAAFLAIIGAERTKARAGVGCPEDRSFVTPQGQGPGLGCVGVERGRGFGQPAGTRLRLLPAVDGRGDHACGLLSLRSPVVVGHRSAGR